MDDLDCSIDLVGFIVNELAQNASLANELENISSINLHHRFIEYKHYKKRMDDLSQPHLPKEKLEENRKEFYSEISAFMHKNQSKIDLNYMLFLFQIYRISEGVKECCEMLDLR